MSSDKHKLREESYYVGVSANFTGKREDKGLVCKVHECPAGNGLISLMP